MIRPRPRSEPSLRLPPSLPVLAALLLAGAAAGSLPAQDSPPATSPAAAPADTAPRGELRDRVVSDADPDRSYALLLPPGYDGREPRPLLLVLDPRGRALRALEIFREGAERRGWIVMSSYDTRSDSAGNANEAALRAMITDADTDLAVDARRLYLAGFSGTARIGWLAASSLSDHVAGLIGVGAGFPPALATLLETDAAALPSAFAFWGGTGRLGFNYEEVRRLDERLDGLGVNHRVEFYPGGHGWLPSGQALEAVDWMELQAMRSGLARPDSALVDRLYREAVTTARAAEAGGRPVEALALWRRVATDFTGLRPVEEALRRASELSGHPRVRRHRERRERLAEEHGRFLETMRATLGRMADGGFGPGEAARDLGLETLRRRAGAEGDTLDAQHAGRLLEQVYVQASFYLPRQALREGDADAALAYLDLAERARPGRGRTRWFRARALTLAGREEEAMEVAAGLIGNGFPRSVLASDPWLDPLRDETGWEDLVGEGNAPPP